MYFYVGQVIAVVKDLKPIGPIKRARIRKKRMGRGKDRE
jgi:hypothetical protein